MFRKTVQGLFYGDAGQLWAQLFHVFVGFIWAWGLGWLLFTILKRFMAIRVSPEAEIAGHAGADGAIEAEREAMVLHLRGAAKRDELRASSRAECGGSVAIEPRKAVTAEDVEAYAGPLASSGGRHALLQTSRQCIPPNADEIIAKVKTITVPTLILWGRQDGVIPLKVGELLHQAIPNSKLEVIERCGHIPHEEKPVETIARIADFLSVTARG